MRARALSQNHSSQSSTPSSSFNNNNGTNIVTIPRSFMPAKKIKSIYEIVNNTYGCGGQSIYSLPQSTSSNGSINYRNKKPSRRAVLSSIGADSSSNESQRPHFSESYSNRSNYQIMTENTYFSEQFKNLTPASQQIPVVSKQQESSTPNSTLSSSSSFEAAFISTNMAFKKMPQNLQNKQNIISAIAEEDLKENIFASSNFHFNNNIQQHYHQQPSQKIPLFKLSSNQVNTDSDRSHELKQINPAFDSKEPIETFEFSHQQQPQSLDQFPNTQYASNKVIQSTNQPKGRAQTSQNIMIESHENQLHQQIFQNNSINDVDLKLLNQNFTNQQQFIQYQHTTNEEIYPRQENQYSNGGITPLFAGDQEEVQNDHFLPPNNNYNKQQHQIKANEDTILSDNLNEIIQQMRETIHLLQTKDASYRLEISKLKKHNTQLKQIITDNNTKQLPLLDQMRKDGEYIRQLDDQLTIYKQKISTIQKQLFDQVKLQEKMQEQEIHVKDLEEENVQLRITIESILMIQQEQIDKIEQQQQNTGVNNRRDMSNLQDSSGEISEQHQNFQNTANATNHEYFYLPNEEDIIREQVEEEEHTERSIQEHMFMSEKRGMMVAEQEHGHSNLSPYSQYSSSCSNNQDSIGKLSSKKITVNLQTLIQAQKANQNKGNNEESYELRNQKNESYMETFEQDKAIVFNQRRTNLQSHKVMMFKDKDFGSRNNLKTKNADSEDCSEDLINYDQEDLEIKADQALQLFQQARAMLLR